MPRSRPQLSITLPRNFTFHYTEGDPPKTPEREVPVQAPRSPHAEGAYRIKHRSRPPVSSVFGNSVRGLPTSSDIPIPTIETPPNNSFRSLHSLFGPISFKGNLAPVARKISSAPRTPVPRHTHLVNEWDIQKDIGESISRPMSACSLLSDSSDDSNGSLTSYPTTGDGSCTSPESDAPDPFLSKFASIKRGKAKQWADLARCAEPASETLPGRKMRQAKWTLEMDKHLWSTYLTYLQDPTVTPFKMLPGTAPPLGVCHRVAREARRSWRGERSSSRKLSGLLSPFSSKDMSSDGRSWTSERPASPDTIKASRSGSITPTGSAASKTSKWPKSGSSTRRRLRYLCKSKPSIAPHYQRLMQSRSPSPFSSSSRTQSRAQSRLSEVTTSSPHAHSASSFSTRNVQLSLTTSTAASMQPDGPMAQLTAGDSLPTVQPATRRDWFNDPSVPFASGPSFSSDLNASQEGEDMQISDQPQTPRLGSPFGFHTWGPSRSKPRIRPSASRIQSNDESTAAPSLRSPVRLHDTFPYQSVHKRRAINSLDDELSPNGSTMQQSLLDNVFGSPAGARHRRVRSRGFSLGDVNTPNPLEALFTPPDQGDQFTIGTDQPFTSSDGPDALTPTHQIRRLGSPFHGISPRPTRNRGPSRHMATTSLGAYDINAFSSIGETLGQANPMDSSNLN